MLSLHSNGNPITKVGTRDLGIAVIGLTMLLFGRMWIWGLWIWKAVGRFKWGLMNYLYRNMEGFVIESDLNRATWPKRFQGRISISGLESVYVIFWWRMWLLFALVCSLSGARVKRLRLIALAKEVSERHSRDFVHWWSLLKSILRKCSKLRKEKF